jgi:trehalose/maltose hydrolase-like predicted phosphorylase
VTRSPDGSPPLPAALLRRFEAAVFDWDGTAVPDRRADAGRVRELVEALCASGFDVAIVSGTQLGNVDSQLAARPVGPGRLYLCLNRGSEVFAVGPAGPELIWRRTATPVEDAALTAAARAAIGRLDARGLEAALVAERLNRRKIDLIPVSAWADPPKARIGELLAAVEERLSRSGLSGLAEVVELVRAAALDAGLVDPRVTSDVKHVEIGLTDKSDSARWVFGELGRRGLAASAVLLAGDDLGAVGGPAGSDSRMLVPEAAAATKVSVGVEPNGPPPGVVALGGGPAAFARILEDQLRRRVAGELPWFEPEPQWTLRIEGLDPRLERAHETLLTLADGRIGTSGAPLGAHSATSPRVLAAGVYEDRGAESHLIDAPSWSQLPGALDHDPELRRVLDLHSGLLFEQSAGSDGTPRRAVRLSSAVRPGSVALRAERSEAQLEHSRSLLPPPRHRNWRQGRRDGVEWLQVSATRGGVTAAAADTSRPDGECCRVDRVGIYLADGDTVPAPAHAVQHLRAVQEVGFDRLLAEHRAAWGERWDRADIRIDGDQELQRAVRFALFQLMASVSDSGETGLGARGLTGPGYRGHVFWDADVFVLPFLAATRPSAARTMLEYRIRRLPPARAAARALGRAGARFPWESARSGKDVTPRHARLRSGETIPIRTGQLEEHIVADVAWGAASYLDWTGDEDFERGPGLTLFTETARYWASRIRLGRDGRGHIDGVIGPDEYHEGVDDNAFTNVMARWNLRRAADAVDRADRLLVTQVEQGQWRELAGALVDGYDPSTGLYEQFDGFFELEPLVIEEIAPRRPLAVELLLGRERLLAAQVVKQADVLMLHHLLPDEVEPGSLRPNLLYYEPRTAHGSSLSPGVHASLLARAGMLDQALEALELTSRIDLDDLTQTTAAGLHLAAMGSLWQALAFGFAGLRPAGTCLRVDPHLPARWRALEISVRFRGAGTTIRAEHDVLTLVADPSVSFLVADRKRPLLVTPAGLRLVRRGRSWIEVKTS